jgi:predicted MPP superfamily phosphohydrolase
MIAFITISCRSISTPEYTLPTSALSAESVIRIVLISDLHSTIFGKDQSILINKIKQQNPDLILLTGDILDDVVPMNGTQLLLAGISGISPIYYVTGNHEYRSRRIQELRDVLKSYGVIILSDEYIIIEIKENEIIVAGIEDPDKKLYETPDYAHNKIMETQFRELDHLSAYKILLAHRPEKIKYYQKFAFDLILSGHTHGGQVRMPGIFNGLYAPHQGFFPKYAGGIYRYDNSVHIISRGLSISPILPRIFNPPELVVIILKDMLE